MNSTLASRTAVAALLLLGAAVHAEPARLLAAQCAQCHGTNGNGTGFDSLAGRSANDIYYDMVDMRNRLNVESIMDRQAHGYTDAQLRRIAEYFASLPGTGD